jgi:hypothetical protein
VFLTRREESIEAAGARRKRLRRALVYCVFTYKCSQEHLFKNNARLLKGKANVEELILFLHLSFQSCGAGSLDQEALEDQKEAEDGEQREHGHGEKLTIG